MPKAAGSSAQVQPITTTLKNILKDYPPQTCLRELLQNADDSGATELEFVLDTSTYDCHEDDLIDSYLKTYQGPALLARNNQLFTVDDIQSLCKVGDSGKFDDPAVAGKFGRGFNSVYHWTDGPSIYSEDRLLFQDPHDFWATGGNYYTTTENPEDHEDPHCKHAKAHLEAFRCFPFNPADSYDGTIIRIPLRTAEQAEFTRVGKKGQPVDIDEIKGFLRDFADELGEAGLLFLKSIRKVTIRFDDNVISETEVLDPEGVVSRTRRDLLDHIKNQGAHAVGFEAEIRHSDGQGQEKVSRYAVQHELRRDTGSETRDEWASRDKLFPWAAVAAPLSPISVDNQRPKPLFSTLRIQQSVDQPVYLHGLWAITPDRDHLVTSTQAKDWNNYMFTELAVSAWLNLLVSRAQSSPEAENFGFWPNPTGSDTDPTSQIHDVFVDRAIQDGLVIWNTSAGCVKIEDAFCADESLANDEYAPHLSAVGMPIAYLRETLLDRAKCSFPGLHFRSPSTAVSYLVEYTGLQSAESKTRQRLLEYCLSSGQYAQLRNISFWPTIAGEYVNLQQKSVMFFPRSRKEQETFRPARPDITLDLSALTEKAHADLRDTIDIISGVTSLRLRLVADLEYDWPILYPRHDIDDSKICLTRLPESEHVLSGIWDWLSERYQEMDNSELQLCIWDLLGSLFVLPLHHGRVRRLKTPENSPVTLLNTSESECNRLLKQLSDLSGDSLSMLDEELLGDSGVELVQVCVSKIPGVQISLADDLMGLLDFLVSARGWIPSLQDNDRKTIAARLYCASKGHSIEFENSEIRRKLSMLPIFRAVAGKSGDREGEKNTSGLYYKWSSLDSEESHVSIGDLPAAPVITGVTFIDLEDPSVASLSRKFDLVQEPDSEQLLEQFVIPSIEGVSAFTSAQTALLEYILDTSSGLSKTWKTKLQKFKIIPSQSEIGEGVLKSIDDLFDPENRTLKGLFSPVEAVFPASDIFNKHNGILRGCGLQSAVTADVIRSRVRHFESCDEPISQIQNMVNCLMHIPLTDAELNDSDLRMDLQFRRWIPANSGIELALRRPLDCRPIGDRDLVSYVLGITEVHAQPCWVEILGWKTTIGTHVLLDQLRHVATSFESPQEFESSCSKIKSVLDYLDAHHRQEDFIEDLKTMPCFPGRNAFYRPSRLFSDSGSKVSNLAPYLGRLKSKFVPPRILSSLAVQPKPVLEDLLILQEELPSGATLTTRDLKIAIAILDLASADPNACTAPLKGPDEDGILANISDLTIKPKHHQGGEGSETIRFAHPEISLDTLDMLEISTMPNRLLQQGLDLDDDEFAPYEDITTVISECITRYPATSTFTEFLANAEDCGATTVSWCIDENPEVTSSPNKDLECVLGPALIVYNDGVFQDEDFKGLLKIGIGSKFEDEDSIGTHGRGVLTMYHFTDTPMILSESTLLILDPQQNCLPRRGRNGRNERLPGLKISISKAKAMFPEVIALFDGLYGYSAKDDKYDGTIFRFPFRRSNPKSRLGEEHGSISVSGAWKLLEDYLQVAKKSLLFLRNIQGLNFSAQGGERSGCQWSVIAERKRLDDSLLQELSIHTSMGSDRSSAVNDTASFSSTVNWLVMLQNAHSCPSTFATPRSRRNKEISFGLAAPRDPPRDPRQKRHTHSIFCTLPTDFTTDLPVSFHATLALSSDRQTIPFGDSARREDSEWNKWLLLQCIPELYITFLLHANPLLQKGVYRLWPQQTTEPDEISKAVKSAFWEYIANDRARTLNLFPTVQASASSASDPTERSKNFASLETAHFDFLSSRILTPLFVKLFRKVVRIPPGPGPGLDFWNRMPKEAYNVIDSEALCRLLQNDGPCAQVELELNNRRATDSGSEVRLWNHLLLTMIPESVDSENKPTEDTRARLGGCRVVPLQNGTLGTLEFNVADSSPCYLLGNEEESNLFDFASDILIPPTFSARQTGSQTQVSSSSSPPLKRIIDWSLFNVQQIQLANIHRLLDHPQCPLKFQPSSGTWLQKLWSYMGPNLDQQIKEQSAKRSDAQDNKELELRVFRDHGLQGIPFYLSETNGDLNFISHEEFESRGLIKPIRTDQESLCSKIPGLALVLPAYVPSTLQNEEYDLYSKRSFERFLRCLALLERGPSGIGRLLADNLACGDLEALQGVTLHYLRHFIPEPPYLHQLRKLPIFPRAAPGRGVAGSSNDFISLDAAKICLKKEMLHPWVTSLEDWMEPTFYSEYSGALDKLRVYPFKMQKVWQETQSFLPEEYTEVDEGRRQNYVRFIQETLLYQSHLQGTFPIAVDERYRLRFPGSLYDHEEPLFKAAFRDDDGKFLHPDVRDLSPQWKTMGLKIFDTYFGELTGDLQTRYRECIQALCARRANQKSGNDEFLSDCNQVTGIACHRSAPWSSHIGKEIMRAPIFEVRDVVESEASYRRRRMSELAAKQRTLAPVYAGRIKYIAISWSQLAYLKQEPVEHLYQSHALDGEPPVDVVLAHLNFLVDIRQEVLEVEIPLYLRDLQETYLFLQSHWSAVQGDIDLRTSKLWLNLETADVDQVVKEDLEGSLISADQLCFRCPVDPEPLKFVRSFLTPYEKLLVALGCQSVKQPSVKFTYESLDGNDSHVARAVRSINGMRKQGRFSDIELSALDNNNCRRTVQAHRLILSASSAYFFKIFSGQWKEEGLVSLDRLMSYENLLLAIDFMYTGSIDFPDISESDGTEVIADKLDSCLDILRAADYLQIAHLHSLVERHIVEHSRIFIRPDNVRDLLEISAEAGANNLKRYCGEFESENRDVVDRCGSLMPDEDTES